MERRRIVQGRDGGLLAIGDERRRGRSELLVHAVRTEPYEHWKYVARSTGLQSELPQRVLTNVSLCPAIAVRGCDITLRYITLRDVAFLRPQPRTDFPNVFTDVACPQPHLPGILTHESEVLAHLAIVFADITAIQSSVAVVQPDITQVLADQSLLQPGVSTL